MGFTVDYVKAGRGTAVSSRGPLLRIAETSIGVKARSTAMPSMHRVRARVRARVRTIVLSVDPGTELGLTVFVTSRRYCQTNSAQALRVRVRVILEEVFVFDSKS